MGGVISRPMSWRRVLLFFLLIGVSGAEIIIDSTFSLTSSSSFYRSTGESRGGAHFFRGDSTGSFRQNITYETFTDHAAPMGRYYLLVDGEKLYHVSSKSSLGFEWIPSFYQSKFDYALDTLRTIDSGYGVVSLSVGPVFSFSLGSIPIRLSGGGAIDVWNEELHYYLHESSWQGTEVDGGGYFSATVGDISTPLFEKIPLYGQGEVFGRYMQSEHNSNFTRGGAVLAYAADSVWGADSLVVSIGDTLLHGRIGGVYSYSGGAREKEQPSRVNNNFGVSFSWLGIGYGKGFVTPNLYFSIYDGRYYYLYPDSHQGMYSPRKRTRMRGGLELERVFAHGITLQGGLFVGGGHDVYFYRSSLVGYQGGRFLTPQEVDTATVKLNDADYFTPELSFMALFPFAQRWKLSYTFTIMRERKLFPYSYVSGADTVSLSDNSDRARYGHQVSVSFTQSSNYTVSVVGELGQSQLNFLDTRKSGASRIDKRYKVDLIQEVTRDSLFSAKVVLGAAALPQEYLYLSHAPAKPSHSRRFYVLSQGDVSVGRSFSLLGRADYYYRDQGVLSGEYYGISDKNYEFTGDLGFAYHHRWLKSLRFGMEFKRQRIAVWSDGEQDWIDWVEVTNPITGDVERQKTVVYQFAPYVVSTLQIKKAVQLRGKIKQYIDIVGSGHDNYWDIALNIVVDK